MPSEEGAVTTPDSIEEELEAATKPTAPDEPEDNREVHIPDEDDPEEILQPKVDPIERHLFDEKGRDARYIQEPLKYFAKLQLYGIMTEAVDRALSGENPINVADFIDATKNPQSLFDTYQQSLPGADTAPDRQSNDEDEGGLDSADIQQAGQVMQVLVRLGSQVPELAPRIYCLALGAPVRHWGWLIDHALPLINDDVGEDILETFIDQNWTAIERFFTVVLPRILRRAMKARERSLSAR